MIYPPIKISSQVSIEIDSVTFRRIYWECEEDLEKVAEKVEILVKADLLRQVKRQVEKQMAEKGYELTDSKEKNTREKEELNIDDFLGELQGLGILTGAVK